MQTPTPRPPRKRFRDAAKEKPVTVWIPVELARLLDERVRSQQARLIEASPGARVTRHGIISAAIRKFVETAK